MYFFFIFLFYVSCGLRNLSSLGIEPIPSVLGTQESLEDNLERVLIQEIKKLCIFGCAQFLFLQGPLPSCLEHGLLRAGLLRGGFSCRGAPALGRSGFSSWGAWA